MKKHHCIIGISIVIANLFSCNDFCKKADGYGNFEAIETTFSAENNGKLMPYKIDEGNRLQQDVFIGYMDTKPLTLKREQLLVSKAVIVSKSKGVLSQINALQAKQKGANTDKNRIQNMLKDHATTQKQLDDILGEMDVITQQIRSFEIQNTPVVNELKSMDVQLKQIDDQIQKSKIINPISRTVLNKYAEPNEITAFGKPLYKITDLSTMQLRVYKSDTQLANLIIGDEVTVKIDKDNAMKSYKGSISWIASEAEFTPKIIQTKEERVALVYAVKIDVINDGKLQIGMPAELWIHK